MADLPEPDSLLGRLVGVLGAHEKCGYSISLFDGNYCATYECGTTARIETSMADAERVHRAEALRATVIEIVQEALTDCLHPEFGSEWQEPDGLLFKAYVNGKSEGWEECAEYCENDPALRFHLRKKNPYA